jgi:3',5'-cyclic-AMP phosphodiesterase
MSTPFVLVQLSDPHIGADWGYGDPVAKLAAAVACIRAVQPSPDAVLVSGDLAEHGADAEYEQIRAQLACIGAPVHVLAGNHDDRRILRRQFGLAGAEDEPVQYAVDLGPLLLVALDSTVPGEADGQLDAERLAWLEATLDAARGMPTVVAMHHPPFVTGIPAMDAIGLPASDRRALGEVVGRHPQVLRIVAGHVHRSITAVLAGRPVVTVPSTYVQARLDFRSPELAFADEPAGFAVHGLLGGELVSHVQPVFQGPS